MVAVDPDLTFEPREVSDTAAEKVRYQAALGDVFEKTQAQAALMKFAVGENEAEIMAGHIILAQDPGMTDAISGAIDGGACAAQARGAASTQFQNKFLSIDDEKLRHPPPHKRSPWVRTRPRSWPATSFSPRIRA